MKRLYIASLSAFALIVSTPFVGQVPGIAPTWQSTSAIAQSNKKKPQLELRLDAKKQVIVKDQQGKEVKQWESLQNQAPVKPGDILQYTLTGKNEGNTPIKNLVLNQPIPKQMKYVLKSTQFNGDGKITYSIDDGKTFVEKPTVKVTRKEDGKDKEVTEDAPAEKYTHIRIQVPFVKAKGTVTATYETQVR